MQYSTNADTWSFFNEEQQWDSCAAMRHGEMINTIYIITLLIRKAHKGTLRQKLERTPKRTKRKSPRQTKNKKSAGNAIETGIEGGRANLRTRGQ